MAAQNQPSKINGDKKSEGISLEGVLELGQSSSVEEGVMRVAVSQTDVLTISVKFLSATQVLQIHLGFWDQGFATSTYLSLQIMSHFKLVKRTDVLKEVKLDYQSHVHEKICGYILQAIQTMNETKKKIYWYRNQPKFSSPRSVNANQKKRCLFVNMDDNEFGIGMFSNMQALDDSIIYMNASTGFDKDQREWSKAQLPFSPREFIEYLFENEINVLMTLNIYLLDLYMKNEGVFLDQILDAMGIKIVCYYIDPFSINVFGMACKRLFSNGNIFAQNYQGCDLRADARYGIEQKIFVSLPTKTFDNKTAAACERALFPECSEKPKILVMSNLRLLPTLRYLPHLYWLHERFDQSSPLLDYQDWFHSMSSIISQSNELDDYGHDFAVSEISNIAYSYGHLFKVLAIDALKDDFEIEIYGDQSWGELFPEQFQNKYLTGDEKIKALRQKNSVLLMFNWNESWLVGANVIPNIWNKVPFVNFPPHVVLPEYAAMNQFCYYNLDDLKNKLSNPVDYNKPDIQNCIQEYLKHLKSGWAFSAESALNPTESRYSLPFTGGFGKEFKRHEDEKNKRIEAFVDARNELIEHSFQLITVGNKSLTIPTPGQGKFKNPIFKKLFYKYKMMCEQSPK